MMRSTLLPLLLLGLFLLPAHARASIDPADARSIFDQAQALCSRDNGALWGQTLCGPMLLLDPDDRSVAANQADSGGSLIRTGHIWTGTVPPSVTESDTTITWSGVRWCELLWPWPMREDTDMRHVTLMHENFHRIEAADLGIRVEEGDNRHLDTLEGRFLMEIEWRALATALKATTPDARRTAISDATLFRRERYLLFPAAENNEAVLENNEGIYEYTGVRLGLPTPAQQISYALRDLSSYVETPSLVRSFAYATGPAWGLLLDEMEPTWRKQFLADEHTKAVVRGLDQRLVAAMHLPAPDLNQLAIREAVYDPNGSLRAHELARENDRRKKAAAYQATLVEGPVLVLPLHHSDYQFKPGTLVALPSGTVYPTMTLTDDWGTLTVTSGGLLLRDELHIATVSLKAFDMKTMHGEGYDLKLNQGWEVSAGKRPGDLVIQQHPK